MKKMILLVIMTLWLAPCLAQTRPSWLQIKDKPGLMNVTNVKDFGATGDGTTDDRPFIQAAIDDVLSKGGGMVYFPLPTVFYNLKSVHPSEVGAASPTALLIKHPTSTRPRVLLVGEAADTGSQNKQMIVYTGPSVWSVVRNEQDGAIVENMTFRGSVDSEIVFLDKNESANKSYARSVFDGGSIGLQIISCWVSSIDTCMFIRASNTGLRIGDGVKQSTSLTIKNSYANDCGSYGYRLTYANYTSLINCAADFTPVGYYMDGGMSAQQGLSMVNCGAEGCGLPVYINRTEMLIDGFWAANVEGSSVLEQSGTVAGFAPVVIDGSIRWSWGASAPAPRYVLSGTANWEVRTPNIKRKDINWGWVPPTDRRTTVNSDAFSGFLANTATGKVIVLPFFPDPNGVAPKQISVKGSEYATHVTPASAPARPPYSFAGDISFFEYNGTIGSYTLATGSYGIAAVATATNQLLVTLTNTYTSGTFIDVTFRGYNNWYVDYASSSFQLR